MSGESLFCCRSPEEKDLLQKISGIPYTNMLKYKYMEIDVFKNN